MFKPGDAVRCTWDYPRWKGREGVVVSSTGRIVQVDFGIVERHPKVTMWDPKNIELIENRLDNIPEEW